MGSLDCGGIRSETCSKSLRLIRAYEERSSSQVEALTGHSGEIKMAFIARGAAIVANNTAHTFLKRVKRVIIFNSMSRSNDRWLRNPHGDEVTAVKEWTRRDS